MKFLRSVSFFVCSLMVVGGIVVATNSFAQASGAPVQDASSATTTAPNLSGSWQLSWTAANGEQRQALCKSSRMARNSAAHSKAPRGSVSLKGTCNGNQISITVKLPRRQASFTGTVDGDKMTRHNRAGGCLDSYPPIAGRLRQTLSRGSNSFRSQCGVVDSR